MNRILLCAVIALGYILFRESPEQDAKPVVGLAAYAKKMASADRAGLSQAYGILGRSVEADPESEPVFVDTAAVRRAHRAALLVVWRGTSPTPAQTLNWRRS